MFGQWNWIYPHSPEEYYLFNLLFDNKEYTKKIFTRFKELFSNIRPVLGYTIRLGNDWNGRRMMSPEEIRTNIIEIKKRYFNQVKIVVTSDDIHQCKQILNDNSIFFV